MFSLKRIFFQAIFKEKSTSATTFDNPKYYNNIENNKKKRKQKKKVYLKAFISQDVSWSILMEFTKTILNSTKATRKPIEPVIYFTA